jgi:hypothetical protein
VTQIDRIAALRIFCVVNQGGMSTMSETTENTNPITPEQKEV